MRKIWYRRITACFAFCSLWMACYAQSNPPGTVFGIVKDDSGEVIGTATVAFKGTAYQVGSTLAGNYTLSAPAGHYIVQASFVGYITYEFDITLTSDKSIRHDIVLHRRKTALQEVVLDGRTRVGELKESGYNVNAIDINRYRNTTADINEILDKTTGVRVRQSGGVGSDFNFSINGLSGNAVKYFIDGIPMEAMGSIMSLNNIPVNLAKRVEVYKGVVPVEFGADAMGGIVNVVTNQSVKNYMDVSYSIGSFNTHRASVFTQYTHARTGLVIRANGFFNYSKNDYMMRGVEVFDADLRKYVGRNLRRFHDDYLSAMGQIEVGVTGKKWADIFFVGTSYSVLNNQIQTGATQNIVYGDAQRKGQAYNASMRYKKDDLFVKNLRVRIFGSIVKDKFQIVDTAYRKYAWDRSFDITQFAEMSGQSRSLYHYDRPNKMLVGNISYALNDRHGFSFNYTYAGFTNKSFDEYDIDAATNDKIKKQIAGMAYQQNLVNNRLTNVLYVKAYGLNVATQYHSNHYSSFLTGNSGDASSNRNHYGYGMASRYKLWKNIGVKASFEHAYRLQTPEELLGNGITLIPNFNLKPEKSDNINVGAFAGLNLDAKMEHKLFLESGWFYRDAKDFIYTVVYEALGFSQYKNVSNVRIDGFEAELRYSYRQLLNVYVNASYQNAINTTRGDGNTPEITYLNRIPNRPWIFGNAGVAAGKGNLIGKNTWLQLMWDIQYIHWFYLTWEAFGAQPGKATIPRQFIQNASVSYAIKNGKYNLSVECKNLTNALAYDNYKLQKPGIAWYLKARIFLN